MKFEVSMKGPRHPQWDLFRATNDRAEAFGLAQTMESPGQSVWTRVKDTRTGDFIYNSAPIAHSNESAQDLGRGVHRYIIGSQTYLCDCGKGDWCPSYGKKTAPFPQDGKSKPYVGRVVDGRLVVAGGASIEESPGPFDDADNTTLEGIDNALTFLGTLGFTSGGDIVDNLRTTGKRAKDLLDSVDSVLRFLEAHPEIGDQMYDGTGSALVYGLWFAANQLRSDF